MKISDLVLNGLNKSYFLPSIQREFVWERSENRIEKLFDSLLQDYPIGAIIVWNIMKKIDQEHITWEVYKFFDNYDEDDPHSDPKNLNGITQLKLVLDGQQRLTALNIGLQGSYTYSSYNKKKCTKLFINLFSEIENDPDNTYGLKYELKFFEKKPDDSNDALWFEIGRVLKYHDKTSSEDFKSDFEDLIEKDANGEKEKIKKAKNILGQIWQTFCNSDLIHEIPVNTPDDEKVLNIFVRTNDGGLKLEKADLLLSYMESNPDIFQPLRARKEINNFLDEINTEKVDKPNYYFTKDDILKACLVLTDDLSVQYKLSNFNKTNLTLISDNWGNIKKYFTITVNIIAKFGFSYKNLTSKNAIIPIAYYLMKKSYNHSIIYSQVKNDIQIKNEIIRWFSFSLLTGAFGGSSDTTLKNMRDGINKGKSFKDLYQGKSIDIETITKWVDKENYHSKYSHLILMLLSPTRLWDNCHQDHIFPISKFSKDELIKYGIADKNIDAYQSYANSISNLHLLNPANNLIKNNDDFIDWSNNQNKEFLKSDFIPDVDLNFSNFLEFIQKRRLLLIDELKRIFEVKP